MHNGVQRIDELFWEAAQLAPGEERDSYLARVCGEDRALRQRLEHLLQVQPKVESFLERPFAGPDPLSTIDESPAEEPGTQIGPYKLLEQIGEGGMGLVFMAEQTRPLRRRVALKVIKPGMDTRHVVARFEAERQALALMDHPNIAKIHDAGATDSGRPYFVMELVRGVPITEFCDQRRLTTRQRLELFVTVCQAVQHAHQKGIIHRDLKPSNVLVTLHDTVAVPKIIDFGIAKATTQPLTERTLFTNFAQMIGTPLYMSPEQAEMNGLDVDTRSDVYALGVLLYELLTGTTPFESQTLKKVGLEEMRRMIREEEPPTPSQRLSTLNAQVCETVSERRGVDRRRLRQALRGELDWIVMKALEKDRNRRYESASAFAADVQRYLNDDTVSACPPSAGYKLRKFARKNNKLLVTAATFCLVLTAGVVVSTWQAIRAHQSELKASEAQYLAEERFQLAKEAVDKYLNEVTETPELKNANSHELRKKLLETALPFYQKLAERTPGDWEGKAASGAAYLRLGRIRSDLGDHAAAITHFEQARSLFAELAEQHTDNPTFRRELGRSYDYLALRMRETGRPEVAEANYRAAVIVNEKLVDDFPADAEYRRGLASTYDNLGLHLWFVGRAADAETSARSALIVRQKLADDFPLNADYQNGLAETLICLSSRRLEAFQDAAGAKALLDEGRRHHEAAMTLNPRQPAYRELFAENRRWLSKALLGMGDFEGLHSIVRMIQFTKPNAMICVDGRSRPALQDRELCHITARGRRPDRFS
jgi:serine/threonine protein kinase